MYPATFFGMFPPFPRSNRVFVAIQFGGKFDTRWEDVLAPAIRSVSAHGESLVPHRADLMMSGDSILTEILDQLSSCRLIVADISTTVTVDSRPMRNQNVFYELGLAHAIRLPEEVLVFRSDSDQLAFDISNVRVHAYDPEGGPDEAKALVASTIEHSLRELDVRRHLRVVEAANTMEGDSLQLLLHVASAGFIEHEAPATMGQMLSSVSQNRIISRLLQTGALKSVPFRRADYQNAEDSLRLGVFYEITGFGEAILRYMVNELDLPTDFRVIRRSESS